MEFKKRLDRYLVYIFTPHPRHPLRTISAYLAGMMWAAVLGNFFYDVLRWLSGGEVPSLLPLWVCVVAVLLLVILSCVVKVPQTPPISSTPQEVEPPPMKGLILLLSSYNPRGKVLSCEEFKALTEQPGTFSNEGKTAVLSFEQFAELLNKSDKNPQLWKYLEEAAKNSNLDVPLQAIRHHLKGGSLCHVWLICTDDGKDEQGEVIPAKDKDGKVIKDNKGQPVPVAPGSWRLAPHLEKFIHKAPHQNLTGDSQSNYSQAGEVKFHYHSKETPKLQCLVNFFGEQGARDVFKAVNYIFDEELELVGLEPEDVICDFTGGRAPHTVGMVLACLPARRRIQYTSSPQTSTGEYVGRPCPREIRADTSWVARLLTLEDLLRRWEEMSED